jgi:5-methylcytosine-specific restriction enzyme subunit McrC
VRNLWLLMLYASDLYRTGAVRGAAVEANPDELPDLVAHILASAVESRLRRRLTHGYRHRETNLYRVRGRIDVLRTQRQQLLDRGMVACRFEELSIDTPRNRFVRAALEKISRIASAKLAHRCRVLAGEMRVGGVSGEPPSRFAMGGDRVARHDSADAVMVAAARLAFDLALPTESEGTSRLPSPDREEVWVRNLFERAVGGFYDLRLAPQGWDVRRKTHWHWPIEQKTNGIDAILQGMETDVVLDHRATGRRIVIDTKFNAILVKGRFREAVLRSGYVFQIYAYLRTQAGQGDPLADQACGMLLHPSVGASMTETMTVQGHAITFATVDLAGTAGEITARLASLV